MVALSRCAFDLLALHHPGAEAAGLFYRAMCERRNGREHQAAQLFAVVAEIEFAPKYRARAIQALGVSHMLRADNGEAVRLYREATHAARAAGDLVAWMRSGVTFSELRSNEGDHKTALETLRAVRPAVEILSRHEPVHAHQFANEAAYELLQAGRLEEARRFALFALSSPVAPAYPEWHETAEEIEQKTASKNFIVVAVSPEPRKRPAQLKFLLVVLRFSPPVRGTRPVAFRQRVTCNNPTVALVVLVARIRAPSFHVA